MYAFGSIVDDLKKIRSKLCSEEDIKEVPKKQLKTEERAVKETVQAPRVTQTSNGDFVITPELRKYYESQPDEKLIEICTSDDYEASVVSLAKKIIKERSRTHIPTRTEVYNKLLAEYGVMEDAQLEEILRSSDNELEIDAAKEVLEVRSVLYNEWVCPMCGAENDEGIFCTRCGYKKS